MTDKDEQEALAWLKRVALCGSFADGPAAATALRLLARPVLPAEPTPHAMDAMRQAWHSAPGDSWAILAEMYRALYAELTKPRTKTVYRISWGDANHIECKTFAAAADALHSLEPGAYTIKPVEIPDA